MASNCSDENDVFNFSDLAEFAEYFSLNKKTVTALNNNGICDGQQLADLKDDDIATLKLPKAQAKLLRAGVFSLRSHRIKHAPAPPAARLATRAQASDHLQALINGSPLDGTSDDDDLPPQALDGAQRPGVAHLAFDPRSGLILKARSTKALHITEFLPDHVKRRRNPRNNFRLQATSTEACTIVQDTDCSYAGLSMDEWGGCQLSPHERTTGVQAAGKMRRGVLSCVYGKDI
jgi:hypothetical protein